LVFPALELDGLDDVAGWTFWVLAELWCGVEAGRLLLGYGFTELALLALLCCVGAGRLLLFWFGLTTLAPLATVRWDVGGRLVLELDCTALALLVV
jgi:hypothetical protein